MALTQQSGFAFPMIQKGPRGRLVYLTQDTVGLINASITQILLTMPGERWWNPSFGCLLRKMNFESLSETTISTTQNIILQALAQWEPRVTVKASGITVKAATPTVENAGSPGIVISISYTVNNPDFTASRQPTAVTISL